MFLPAVGAAVMPRFDAGTRVVALHEILGRVIARLMVRQWRVTRRTSPKRCASAGPKQVRWEVGRGDLICGYSQRAEGVAYKEMGCPEDG